jgi:hypothetical protein
MSDSILQADSPQLVDARTYKDIFDDISLSIKGMLELSSDKPSELQDSLLIWMDDLIWLFFRLCVDSTLTQRTFSIVHFIKSKFMGKTLPTRIYSRIEEFVTYLFKGPVLQSGDLTSSSSLRHLLDNWSRLNDSPLAYKMRSLLAYCMSFSVLEVFGFPPTFADIIYDEFNVDRRVPKKKSYRHYLCFIRYIRVYI